MAHSSDVEMIQAALSNCKHDKKGISQASIQKYIKKKFHGISNETIIKNLKNGIDNKLWIYGDKRCKGDNTRYKLFVEDEEEDYTEYEEDSEYRISEEEENECKNKKKTKKRTRKEFEKKMKKKKKLERILRCDACNSVYNKKTNNVRFTLCLRCKTDICSVCEKKNGGFCWQCADKYRRKGYKLGTVKDALIYFPGDEMIGPIKQSEYNKIKNITSYKTFEY